MSDDLVRRAAALVEKQKAWDAWEYPSQPAPPAMVEGEVATLVSDMADEITRLRAELATALREGMEDAARRLEELHKNHGYDAKTGEVRRRGELITCPLTIDHAIGYYRAIAEGAAHILRAAAMVDNRPSEEVIREDRDAWPDHQANDLIATAKEVKP